MDTRISKATLSIVATPIGNLGDLSPRALKTLHEAEIIFCEDTRQTAKLLQQFEDQSCFEGRLTRLDEYTQEERILEMFQAALSEGLSRFAFVSDAGTPGVSDPGAKVIKATRALDLEMVAVPGPSALAAVMSLSGMEVPLWGFGGFFPRKDSEREIIFNLYLKHIKELGSVGLVFFEFPERVIDALEFLNRTWPASELCVVKELTKIYEKTFRGSPGDILREWGRAANATLEAETQNSKKPSKSDDEVPKIVASESPYVGSHKTALIPKGEWTFAIKLSQSSIPNNAEDLEQPQWRVLLEKLLNEKISAKNAVQIVCQVFGMNRNLVYKVALELKKK